MHDHAKHHHHDDVVFMKFRHGGMGPFGGGFGPMGPGFGPMGPGPRMRGRRRRGDVRLALLMLLNADGPANGYQLMQGLAQRSDGRWQPSPGSVYPALSQLEDEGLIRGTQTEGESGRTFELTDAGRAQIAEQAEARAPWEPEEGEENNPRMALRNAIISAGRAAWHVGQDGSGEQIEEAVQIINEARRQLYRLLAGEEQS